MKRVLQTAVGHDAVTVSRRHHMLRGGENAAGVAGQARPAARTYRMLTEHGRKLNGVLGEKCRDLGKVQHFLRQDQVIYLAITGGRRRSAPTIFNISLEPEAWDQIKRMALSRFEVYAFPK